MNLTKRQAIRSKAIRNAANGEPCTWPGCGVNDGTTVLAHSDMSIHGKGMKRKAEDVFSAFLCGRHHAIYGGKDMPREEKEWYFMRAMSATWLRLIELGIIKVKK